MSDSEKTPPKRVTLQWSEVDAMSAEIPRHEKTSFVVIGHRTGVRVALPKTVTGVSRAYFYGPYDLIPALPGVTTHLPEARKKERKGGITAEIDFSVGPEAARTALEAMLEVVRAAPAPPARGVRAPRQPRQPKTLPSGAALFPTDGLGLVDLRGPEEGGDSEDTEEGGSQ